MKYKVKQYILRSAPLILVCCMFVFVLSPSASAEPLNYRDYETSVTVDGDNDIVTVTFPSDFCFVSMYAEADLDGDGYALKEYTQSNPGTSITFPWNYGWIYSVSFYPVYKKYIDLSNIPNGTEFTFNVGVDFDNNSNTPTNTPKIQCSVRYYDEVLHDYVQQYTDNVPYAWDVQSYSMILDIPAGMKLADPRFQLYGWKLPDSPGDFEYGESFGNMTVELYSFTATMSISSLYRLQEQTGKTNELLDEVNRQLEEQGKTMEDVLDQQTQTNDKLDDIINGEVNPEAPEGADKVGDLDDAEGQLRDEAQVGLDQGVEIQQSVLQILEEYANGFAVFSWIFGLFAKLPFFSGLLYVSLALGTVSALLGIGFSVARSSAAREAASSYRMAAQWKKGG